MPDMRRLEIADDAKLLRQVFALVPWRMRPQVLGLAAASLAVALLDVIAVAAMLPLTQMLTNEGEVPPLVQNYLVPVLGTADPQTLLLIVAGLVAAAFLGKNVLTLALRWWSIGVVQRASGAAQAEMLKRYVGATYLSHLGRSKSRILQTITSAIPGGLSSVLLGYIGILVDAITVVVLVITLTVMSPVISIIAVVIFGGSALLVSRVLKPWAIRVALQSVDRGIASWGFLNPAIEGFRESRIFGRERHFADAYAENREVNAGLEQKARMLQELPKQLLEIAMIGGILLAAGALFATRPAVEAFALLGVFGIAALRLVPAMNRIVTNLNAVRSGRPALQMLAEECASLDEDSSTDRGRGEEMMVIPSADIVVDGVSFTYRGSDRTVLEDVDVTIRRGTTVALVGASGAGKTTFADILAGLMSATSGSVTVGGVDIAEHPRSWRQNIAMVSQKVYMWEAPLRDLITFGLPENEVDQELVDSAVRRSRLTEVIADLPQGLDTVIGEGGSRLSGGQGQRVGIARALYADPQVLILDEATSALDNETEHEIAATIDALQGEITVIVVAHRLSTVKNADEILFFSRGRLTGRGSMDELRNTNAEFAHLVELGKLS